MLFSPLFTFETYRPYLFSFTIPGTTFTIEPRFYGVFYAISLILGYRILLSEVHRLKIHWDEDQCMNYVIMVFFCGLLGARAYEVLFEWSNHYSRMPWWEVFAVWHGGLAIHGSILGGLVAVYVHARKHKILFRQMGDIALLCVVCGQMIGRWGNFTNGEAAGPITTFWTGVVFPPGSPTYHYAQGQAVHPTMIYESLACALLFGFLWKIRNKGFRPGTVSALYFLGYAAIRSSLTPLRMDNQYFEWNGQLFLAAYSISAAFVVAALFLIFRWQLWKRDVSIGSLHFQRHSKNR